MLRPSGGVFKKLFSPENMKAKKKVDMSSTRSKPAQASGRKRTGSIFGRAANKAY